MKLDIEKALIEKGYQNKDGSFSMLSEHFTAGANYTLEQLSKSETKVTPEENELAKLREFKDFFQPRMTELKSKLAHETNIANGYCELANKQAGEIMQANAKNAALELELRKAKVESEMLRAQRNKYLKHSLATAFLGRGPISIAKLENKCDAEIEAAKAGVKWE